MLKFLVFALSFSALADSFTIESYKSRFRVGDDLAFRLIQTSDEGVRLDITHEASWYAPMPLRQVRHATFMAHPTRGGRHFNTQINASVTLNNGESKNIVRNITIDATPDRIAIQNRRFYVNSNWNYRFRAVAYYGARSFEITNLARWRSWEGRISGGGFYTAPPFATQDEIEVNYGGRYDRMRLTVQF